MKNKSEGSLSSEIVLSVTLISFFITLLVFIIFEKINKEAFYNIEIEKANIIARTIEPLIALNIYLDMGSRIDEIGLQLIENPNILALKVLRNDKTINEVKSKEYENGIDDSFIVEQNIFQPNSKKKTGSIVLTYSSKNYEELTNKYTKFTIVLFVLLGILFLLLGLYIKRLLLPLRIIATSLKNYSPDKEIDIPFTEVNSEIGLISTALNSMQHNILQYAKKQQNINHYLEEKVAEKLVSDIEKMIFLHENNEIAIRVTIGGVYQIEGALEKADIALKSAKMQEKSYLIYGEKFNVEKQYKDNMEWVKKLKTAIKQDKIVPYFQPIFDNKSNKIVSCECLIRLIDDDDNVIAPYKFLTITKKSRLYYELTKIMVQKSCHYFEHLDCDFSINLSVEDMLNTEIVDYIKHTIKKYNVTSKIIFEILESEGIENYEEISIFINEIKALGCRIAIDDFGSGYSNFEHLLKLNIDYIKIDGSLIKNLDKDKNAQIIVETIVDFAKKLNILTIAEFVHNEAVSIKVKELQVDRTQGFFLAQPQEHVDL